VAGRFAAVTAARRRVLLRHDREQPSCGAASTRSDARSDSDPWISANDRGAATVPVILPSFSDLRWFRGAFPDWVACGFFSQRRVTLSDAASLGHGAEELIDVWT